MRLLKSNSRPADVFRRSDFSTNSSLVALSAAEDFDEGGAQSPVLVVDDRHDKRLAISAVLEGLGVPVVLAESGMEALRHLLREDYSVILLDLIMPEIDGIELAGMIRSRRRSAKTPIIFYTADMDAAESKRSAVYGLGAVDLLVAPIPAEVLRAKVAIFADFHRRLLDVRRVAGERERLLRAEAARAEAERASAAKDHFLAMLSHELRTPLSPVLNTIELMLENQDHPESLRRDLDMIRRNVVLEARLIDDLLDLTRVSRGKVSLKLESVDVYESLQNVLQICGPEIDEKHIVTKVARNAANHMVRADAARLKQILWNLIRNAVKYTDSGGAILISLSNSLGGWLCIKVKDPGCGISPELLPGIFEAFRQGAHTTGGLGLGLAISRSLVELHGGTIEAHSDGINKGATFTLYLPCSTAGQGELVADAQTPSLPAKPATPAKPERLTASLLLVEDHADSRATLARLLKRRGYAVETAEDVKSALEATRKTKFDVILSDIGLPDGTGHDFLTQVPLEERRRAIALSGFGMEEDLVRSAVSGFARHLTKPVDLAELDTTIQFLLSSVPIQ